MKILRKSWKWFNGKKTAIGYIGIQFCVTSFAKQHIDQSTLELMQLGFTVIGGTGVIHKVTKSETIKKVSSNLNKNINLKIKK